MKSERFRFWIWTAVALLAGVLLRLWFVAHLGRVAGDSLFYGEIAKTWLQHGVYGVTVDGSTPGSIVVRPTLARLPGYPLFLAACFRLFGMENYRAVLQVQVAVDMVSCCLVSALAGRLFGRRARLPVLWTAALCPFTANYTSTALAETLVLATIALAFYAFARWQDASMGFNRWLWVVTAALAYSILLRPEQGLLAAAVLPAMLCRSLAINGRDERWHTALPVLAAAFCIALPLLIWTARNERIFHVFQPLSPRDASDPGEVELHGFSRWYDSWAIDFASTDEFCWPMDGEPIEFTNLPERAFAAATPAASQDMRQRTAVLLDYYNANLILTPEIDSRFGALGDELIQAHPVQYYFGLHVARMMDMTLRPRTEMMPVADEWWRWKEHRAQTAFAAAYAMLNLAYFVIAFCGFRIWKRNAWRVFNPTGQRGYRELAMAMVASLVLRATLLLFIDNSEPRYTLEFFPVFFVWMGALFAVTRKSRCKPNRISAALRCICLCS
jgi:4-amino-4-deoxy-L-arabinose transferase-like glycosyltransferase